METGTLPGSRPRRSGRCSPRAAPQAAGRFPRLQPGRAGWHSPHRPPAPVVPSPSPPHLLSSSATSRALGPAPGPAAPAPSCASLLPPSSSRPAGAAKTSGGLQTSQPSHNASQRPALAPLPGQHPHDRCPPPAPTFIPVSPGYCITPKPPRRGRAGLAGGQARCGAIGRRGGGTGRAGPGGSARHCAALRGAGR